MKRLALAFCLAVFPAALHAQSAYLVKDINATTAGLPVSSSPQNFFKFGSKVVFAGSYRGSRLWITDGTAAGTSPLATATPPISASRFVVMNGTLFFNFADSAHGEELWSSDGTAAGTKLFTDIKPGVAPSSPGDRIVYHGQMLFAADDGIDGGELWITDGTPAGTHFFKDLVPGARSSDPASFVLLNDVLYFVAGGAIWTSDGTPAGTVAVTPVINAGNLVVVGSRLFFGAYSDATGFQPWVSDGTAAGTHMIAALGSGAQPIMAYRPVAFGDRALFVATDAAHGTELWISDGTAAGTHVIRDIGPGPVSGIRSGDIAVFGGNAYFAGSTDGNSSSLWRTDGTEAGTVMVRDFGGGQVTGFVTVGNRLFFVGAPKGGTATLWVSDGTSSGTHPVKASDAPAIQLGSPLTNIDGTLYFSGANPVNGYEPWKSDGTDAGTVMISNLEPDPAPSSMPRYLTAAGNDLYFDAWDGSGTPYSGDGPRTIWRSDGTAEGTLELTDEPSSSFSPGFAAVGQTVFFNKDVLWMSDGTPQGTGPATEFASRFPQTPNVIGPLGDKVLVRAGNDLWATMLPPGSPAVRLSVAAAGAPLMLAGRGYFTLGDFGQVALWTTDGTSEGTYAVVQFTSSLTTPLAVMGGQLYFAMPGTNGVNLWKSEGTYDGTTSFATVAGSPSSLTAAGHNLFFTINGQLWVTDGTQVGTRSLNVTLPDPKTLKPAGDRVVFVANDATNGSALWASDGTADGTRLLTPFAAIDGLTPADGRVYFRAFDSVHGSELFVTDGTAAGTQLASDIEPGPGGSYPMQLVAAGGRLFFTATTTATGTELWALPLTAAPRLAIADVRVREGDTGITNARFTVTLSPAATQSVTVDYATSDGTATAGSDYDALSGTLTFAPGETSKNIDVPIHGDTTPENNETFFVTLRNPTGATLRTTFATGIIEDDDQFADLALSLDFSRMPVSVGVIATNKGPRSATSLKVTGTASPYQMLTPPCSVCTVQLAPSASARLWDSSVYGLQQYVTATVTARQPDPQPSNNRIGFIAGGGIAMDALYLTTGGQANVWFSLVNDTTATVTSSDPSIVSVPPTVAITGGKPASFVVHGVATGRAVITVTSQKTPSVSMTMAIDVVAPGSVPRVPGAIAAATEGASFRFDRPATMRIDSSTTAPFSGSTATGLVTITANGKVGATLTLTPAAQQWSVPFYLADIGPNHVVVSYAGDANFLPASVSMDLNGEVGYTSILGDVERNGTNAIAHVQVTGSPRATPAGTIMVQVQGSAQTAPVPLQTRIDGIAVADVPLTNFGPGTQTLFITYSGDPHYAANSQTIRIADVHKRSTRH